MQALAIDLCERGLVSDGLMRLGMRRLMAARLREQAQGGVERQAERHRQVLEELAGSRIAIDTDKANEQHYELPAGFFAHVLGPHLKYSCALWAAGDTLADAEERMLALTSARAGIGDGQNVLDLGCGWGSLTLWIAGRYPAASITAVSNSVSQREFILARARSRGLTNLRVVTADANDFDSDERFDRVVSVEMFEHMRNYRLLMERISRWLTPDGRLFVHVFCHRRFMYPFTTHRRDDWMGRYFFTGGLMPAEDTLPAFQEHLRLEERWRVPGWHYQHTANAWMERMDASRDRVMEHLAGVYGQTEAARWFNRWRMFFMACAELFGYEGGTEWLVAHYRFAQAETSST